MKKTILVIAFLLLAAAGCAGKNTKDGSKEHADRKSVEIAKSYQDIYEKACKDGTLEDLATIRQIVERLGEDGLVAVDAENQVDMENAAQAEEFCKRAGEGKEAVQTIIAVKDDGGFMRYDLEASEGTLKVRQGYVAWSNGEPVEKETDEYQAYAWNYSGKGYLFFEKYQPPGYDGFSGHTAIRVKPLDQDCRELNQKYIMPVGYRLNNMFLEDWSENDYGNLNFYDIFEPMYQMKYGKRLDVEFAFTGKTYDVPEEEFENVFLAFFQIDLPCCGKRPPIRKAVILTSTGPEECLTLALLRIFPTRRWYLMKNRKMGRSNSSWTQYGLTGIWRRRTAMKLWYVRLMAAGSSMFPIM